MYFIWDILIENLIFLIAASVLELTLNSDRTITRGYYRIIPGIYRHIYATVNAIILLD